MKIEADSFKKMYALKKGFVKPTNSKNWEDAVSQFPRFACETELKKFTSFDVSKGHPQPFVDFCKRAKSYGQSSRNDNEQGEIGCVVKNDDAAAFAITGQVSELNGHIIASTFSKFSGADLIFLSINQVCH